MREALALAQSADAPVGENPRVGCVIVADDGTVVGRGYHRGAGSPHAEVVALADAGVTARGATAVVTLEPCRHLGRTGPCTEALIAAGITRVIFAQSDPTQAAGGGGLVLRTAGLDVRGGVLAAEAERVNADWTFAEIHRRPLVTWKAAVSLDGRVAGPDGGPTAITADEARADVQRLRAQVGAIIVGTGTALADNPHLTVRGVEAVGGRSVLRVVVGSRPVPDHFHVHDDEAPSLFLADSAPVSVLSELFDRGVRHVLLEGGPTLAAAFLSEGLVDRIVWYVAPMLLGDGPVALAAPPDAATRPLGVDVDDVTVVGEDVRIRGWVTYERAEQ